MQSRSSAIYIHAGAPGQASAVFQRYLSANRQQLRASGYALSGRDRAGEGDPKRPLQLVGQVGPAATPNPGLRGTVLSAQDLFGDGAGLLGGRFYPDAKKRAAELRAAVARPIDRLVVSVRPYDELFRDIWRGIALHRPVEAFDTYVPALAGFTGGWVDLVEALRHGLQPSVTLVVAADMPPHATLGHLIPEALSSGGFDRPMVPKLTDSAVAMVQHHRRLGLKYAPGQLYRILAFHAGQPQVPPSGGLEGLILADMRGRYIADLDTLSRLSGVALVGDTATAMAAE